MLMNTLLMIMCESNLSVKEQTLPQVVHRLINCNCKPYSQMVTVIPARHDH